MLTTLQLAPVSILEFAQLAHEAGSMSFRNDVGPVHHLHTVPPDVLNVLPGAGPEMGKEIVTHPATRKVDVTVRPFQ
jgi:acyl-CoA reductase-like NAD-dependent aldehyde dehydrogenase